MKDKDSSTKNIVTKLKLAEEMYDQASVNIRIDSVKDRLKMLSERKEMFLTEIYNRLAQSDQPASRTARDETSLESEQTGMELNKIIQKRNERDLLVYCIRCEEELINSYQKALTLNRMDYRERIMYKNQLTESLTLFNQLKMTKESFHYQNRL